MNLLKPLGMLKSLWNGIMNWVPNEVFASGGNVGGCGNARPLTARQGECVETLYTSGKILGETLGSFPFHIYKGHGKDREMLPDHPVAKLFKNPGLNLTRQELIERAVHGCVFAGRGAFHKVKNARGEVLQLVALDPAALEDHLVIMANQYKRIYTYNKQVVDASDLWIPSNVWGLSPLAVLAKQTRMVQGYEDYATAMMRNGAKPSGVLSHPGKLDVEAKEKLKAAWREKYQGTSNTGEVIVLSEDMKWTPTQISNEDLQFIEQYKFTRSIILSVFRIPPHMAGDLEHATFSNIEHQGLEFKQYTMLPLVTRFEESINRDFLADEDGVYCKFNMDALERGDLASRTAAQVLQVTNGLKKLDEVRLLNEDPPYDDGLGSKPMFPMNMQVLGEEPQETQEEIEPQEEMVNDDE